MRLYIDQDNGTVHIAANTGPHITSTDGRLYEGKRLDVFFCRDGAVIRNATAALDLLLSLPDGTNKFDAGRINSAVTFTEQTEGTDYFWRGTLDFAAPVFEKLLGVDVASQRETVSFECVADVGNSLHYKYLKLYRADGGFNHVLFYTSGTAEDAALAAPSGSAGGSRISIATNATATDVATALATATGVEYTLSRIGNVVTCTATSAGARGWHSAGTTGFTMTLQTAGMSPFAVADIASASLLAQFTYDVDGDPQSTQLFNWEVQNTLRRPLITPPGLATGRIRTGTVDIANGTSSVSVVFAQPMPTANYFITASVKNTTDSSPLTLFVGTITAQSTTGFTVQLNGETASANYDLIFKAEF